MGTLFDPYRSELFASIIIVILFQLFGCTDKCDRIVSDDPFAAARCRIKQLMDEKNIVSFQVAVAKDGEIIFEEAFGLANVEKKIPTTPETMHMVASIDKPFTSTALMILAEREQINLHGPIDDYLGDTRLIAYQGDVSDATVARMLLHTTGLPYGYYTCGDKIPLEKHRTTRELIELAGVLVAAPGTRYQYTNFGYGLFDEVVREVSGNKINEFIQEEIIISLGLEHTGYFRSRPSPEKIATQNFKGGVLPFGFDADGYSALYSTAGDLARFGMFHMKAHLPYQQPILSDSGIDMLWQYEETEVKFTTRRLAWDVQEDYGFEVVVHGGGGPGIHNWLYMIPSENVVIALMSNAWYASSDPVLVELIAASISKSGENIFRRQDGRGWPRWPKLDQATLCGEWAGHISGPKGSCPITVNFDSRGNPKMRIDNDSCNSEMWVSPSRKVKKSYGTLLWRFDACIPYLYPFATHDEVILTLWPDGNKLIGSASAAKEKNFGEGENYVLPQYLELTR